MGEFLNSGPGPEPWNSLERLKRAPKPPYRTNYLLGERDGATARC